MRAVGFCRFSVYLNILVPGEIALNALFGICLWSASYKPDPAVGNESVKEGVCERNDERPWIEYKA